MTSYLEILVAWTILVSLIIYAVLAGADFGAGIWDLLAFGRSAREQKDAISNSIAPIWEANHVWLVLIVVVVFTGFPFAFSEMTTALNIPMTAILMGIVLRGAAFTFRKYGSQKDLFYRRWSRIIGISSLLTPFLMGISLGGLASGQIRIVDGNVTTGFFAGWTTPFALACGLFAQGLFAFLAATYLTIDTAENAPVQSAFRARAMASGLALFPIAILVFMLARDGAPYLFKGLTSWWAPILLIWTSVMAVLALGALWRRWFGWARFAAVGQVVLILLGWSLAQFPCLIVPDATLASTAAPANTLQLLCVALAVGALILFPSLGWLFYIFKFKPGATAE